MFTLAQAYLLDEDAGQRLLQLLQGGVTCAVDWWLALMWHYGKIDAAVCMARAAAVRLCIQRVLLRSCAALSLLRFAARPPLFVMIAIFCAAVALLTTGGAGPARQALKRPQGHAMGWFRRHR
jgi:hypothetical protein